MGRKVVRICELAGSVKRLSALKFHHFLELARLLLCKGQEISPTELERWTAQENQVALPLRASHHFWRVRRRSARISGSTRSFCVCRSRRSVLCSPMWAIGAYFALGAGGARLAAAVPEAPRRRCRRQPRKPAAANERTSREAALKRLKSRRGLRPGPRADRTGRGAGAAVARRRMPSARALAGVSARTLDDLDHRASSGSDGAGASMPTRDAARSSRRRIGHQSPTSAVAAPSAQPLRSDIARVSSAWRAATRLDFGLGGAGRARHRADRGRQADQIQPLALERFGGAASQA